MTETQLTDPPTPPLPPGDKTAIESLGAQDYQTFVDTLPDIVWISDAAGRAVYYNNYWYDYTGIDPTGDIRVQGWDALHPDDRGKARAAWEETFAQKRSFLTFEFRLRGKNGLYRWFLGRAVAQYDASGTLLRWIGTATDIEEMKQVETRHSESELQARQAAESLRRSEERYRALVDASSQVVWTNTAEGRMEGAQPGWSSLTGQAEIDYQGYGWSNAVHPDDAQPTVNAWNESVRTRTPFLFEHRVRRQDGTWRLFAIRAVPVLEKNGVIREWVGIHTDITESRKTEQERDALLQSMAEAVEKQRKFLRDMLFSMSEGRLRLCDSKAELPDPITDKPVHAPIQLSKKTIRELRLQSIAACAEAQIPADRENDFVTAVGEAAMNAVVHAGGGTGTVYADKERGIAQIWIVDTGSGINEESLHRATLEKGYTTAGTLGHGFWMMLKTADHVYLLTGTEGTTVVLEQEKEPPLPAWMQTFVDAAR